jgi:hypothetical protein
VNDEFIFCEPQWNISYFEKCPPGVIVNNKFIFCELGGNVSYLEKCPPGVIVNTEFIFFRLTSVVGSPITGDSTTNYFPHIAGCMPSK